jgi:hypothetical protein
MNEGDFVYKYCELCVHFEKTEIMPNSTESSAILANEFKMNLHKEKEHGIKPIKPEEGSV